MKAIRSLYNYPVWTAHAHRQRRGRFSEKRVVFFGVEGCRDCTDLVQPLLVVIHHPTIEESDVVGGKTVCSRCWRPWEAVAELEKSAVWEAKAVLVTVSA